MIYSLQFNDGMGWRVSATFDGELPDAVERIKEHHNRWPKDHIRVVADTTILWWKDDFSAPERWV
jgi:hypothetical protein